MHVSPQVPGAKTPHKAHPIVIPGHRAPEILQVDRLCLISVEGLKLSDAMVGANKDANNPVEGNLFWLFGEFEAKSASFRISSTEV